MTYKVNTNTRLTKLMKFYCRGGKMPSNTISYVCVAVMSILATPVLILGAIAIATAVFNVIGVFFIGGIGLMPLPRPIFGAGLILFAVFIIIVLLEYLYRKEVRAYTKRRQKVTSDGRVYINRSAANLPNWCTLYQTLRSRLVDDVEYKNDN